MSKTRSQISRIKRLLNAGKPITGELLDFALTLVPDPRPGEKRDEVWGSISRKLSAGEPLSGYEHHLMVDMVMLHVGLNAAAAELQESER